MSWLSDRFDDINVFDGGKSAASVRAAKKNAPPAKLPVKNAPPQKKLQKPKQSFWNKVGDVFEGNSEMDMYNRQQAGLPTKIQDQSILSRATRNLETKGRTLARGAQAFGQGIGETYDVLTPGKGSNRLTKMYEQRAKRTDQQVQDMHLDRNEYYGGQVPLAIASYTVPGKVAQGVGKIPTVARATGAVSNVINKAPGVAKVTGMLDDAVANGNVAQRVTSRIAQNAFKPATLADTAYDAIQNAGYRNTKGGDNNWGTVGMDVGLGVATGGLINATGQASSRLIGTPLRNANLIRPVNLDDTGVAALNRFQDARKGLYDMDEVTYQRGVQAARQAGIDYRDPKAVDGVLGAFRHYDTQKGNRKENLLSLKKTIDDKASMGLATKPVDDAGNPIQNFQPRPLKDRMGGKDSKIQEYADMLRSQGEGNGVAITPDGRRISNNFRTAETKGRKMTKQDWYDEAERQVNTGKADPSFMEYFNEGRVSKPAKKPSFENDLADAGIAPGQKPSRFANRTVQNTNEVSPELKQMVKDENVQYTGTTDKLRADKAEAFLKDLDDETAFREVSKQLDSVPRNSDGQEATNAINLIRRLDAKGDEESLFKSTELFHRVSKDASSEGQRIQALAAINARTPQGLFYYADNTLNKALKDKGGITPEMRNDLKNLTDTIKNQKPGSYEDGLARFKLMEYVSRKSPSRTSSKALQLWKAGLLSAPRTTAGNLAANTAESIFKKGYVDPIANFTDALISIFPGMKRSRSYTARGITGGLGEGFGKGVKYFKTGYDSRNPMQKFDIRDIHFSEKPLGRAAEKYTQSIFKLMGAQDQPFYYANLRNSLADQAITAAKNGKLKGAQKDNFIKQFITEPSTEAMQLADKEARYAVFQNETALGKAASKLKSSDGITGDVAEFVMPFSGVPSSVATRMIERTPVGTATEIVRQISRGKYDQRALTAAIANGTAVIPMIGVGKALADTGMITLGYPKDQAERDLWELEGKQPYSIKVGGKWRSMNYFQPAGTLIASGAEYAQKIKDGGSPTEALATAAAGGGKSLTEQSFLKGVSGALGAITDPQTAGERFLEQTAGSVVPNVSRSLANATDSVKRDQDNLKQTVMAGIPGLRQKLPERNNIFGQPIPNQASPLEIGLDPTKPSNSLGKADAVTQELRRLKDVGQPTTTIKLTNSKDLKFTDQQKREFEKATGAEIKTQWDAIVADSRYQALDDETKKKVLRDAAETINGARKKEFLAQNQMGEYSSGYGGKPIKLNTDQKRLLSNKSVDYLGDADDVRTYAEDYDEKLKKYREDEKDLSPVQKTKRQKELRQLKVKKDYDKDTVDLYGMSKADAYDLLSTSDNGKAMSNKLIAYGDALVDAGLAEYNKFRNRKGEVDIRPKETSGSGVGGKRKIKTFDMYSGSTNPLTLSSELRKLLANAKIGGKSS